MSTVETPAATVRGSTRLPGSPGQTSPPLYEVVLTELALATAGVTIRNARLYADSRARERWQRGNNEVSTALLSGQDPEQVLALVARLSCELTDSRTAVVALMQPGGDLVVEAQGGACGASLLGRRLPAEGELGRVVAHGPAGVLRGKELADDVADRGVSSAVALGEPGSARGVLAVLGSLERPAAAQLLGLQDFARLAAVGLQLAEQRHDLEHVAVQADRDRIARDLHDVVIQRLLATGTGLHSLLRLVVESPEEAVARVHRAVDELDLTIRELRSTIYGLQAPADEPPSLRTLLLTEMDAATVQLGFAPSLGLSGMLDTAVGPGLAEQLLAVAREALSNVARHARASRVDVQVSAQDESLVLRVEDDGVGLPPGTAFSGLALLGTQADELGGQLEISCAPRRGTRLLWCAPLASTSVPPTNLVEPRSR